MSQRWAITVWLIRHQPWSTIWILLQVSKDAFRHGITWSQDVEEEPGEDGWIRLRRLGDGYWRIPSGSSK